MLAIYKKELKSYLTSMQGYVFMAFIMLVLGIYFTAYNLNYASPDFGTTLNSVTFVFLIITPILTMRILAEEKRNKTDQLLFTSPVPIWKIVFGKYLGMVTIYLIPVVITLFCSFVMNGIESFFSQTAMASMLAFAVLAVLIAMVVYQMTKDNILTGITGVVLLGAVVIIYIVKSSLYEGAIQKLLDLLAIANHFDNFVGGILDFSGIVYMLSVICIFIFLTVQSIQKRRWS